MPGERAAADGFLVAHQVANAARRLFQMRNGSQDPHLFRCHPPHDCAKAKKWDSTSKFAVHGSCRDVPLGRHGLVSLSIRPSPRKAPLFQSIPLETLDMEGAHQVQSQISESCQQASAYRRPAFRRRRPVCVAPRTVGREAFERVLGFSRLGSKRPQVPPPISPACGPFAATAGRPAGSRFAIATPFPVLGSHHRRSTHHRPRASRNRPCTPVRL